MEFETYSYKKVEKGFASPFEIGSMEIREDLATDLCTPKETQNPKQDPTQDDSRTKALAYKQFYMNATVC